VAYSRRVLDPGLAAFLLAFAFAGLLALPGLRKTARRAEQRFCETCGRLKILGERVVFDVFVQGQRLDELQENASRHMSTGH